jgi:hypothetical protein
LWKKDAAVELLDLRASHSSGQDRNVVDLRILDHRVDGFLRIVRYKLGIHVLIPQISQRLLSRSQGCSCARGILLLHMLILLSSITTAGGQPDLMPPLPKRRHHLDERLIKASVPLHRKISKWLKYLGVS